MDPQLPGDGVENDHYIPHSHFDDYSSDLAAYFELVEKEMIEISEDEEYVKDLIRKQNLTTAEEDESDGRLARGGLLVSAVDSELLLIVAIYEAVATAATARRGRRRRCRAAHVSAHHGASSQRVFSQIIPWKPPSLSTRAMHP